ncbi:hypothetical protein FPHOBKDP_00071 [Listeria phage LPJP1]|nr:hypothetical protein FPHOBKDP_00071 [Listeria phage LPJP1]
MVMSQNVLTSAESRRRQRRERRETYEHNDKFSKMTKDIIYTYRNNPEMTILEIAEKCNVEFSIAKSTIRRIMKEEGKDISSIRLQKMSISDMKIDTRLSDFKRLSKIVLDSNDIMTPARLSEDTGFSEEYIISLFEEYKFSIATYNQVNMSNNSLTNEKIIESVNNIIMEHPEFSIAKIARSLGVSHGTVKLIIENYDTEYVYKK